MRQQAYSYLRVSGKGQVNGDGPERQREGIQEFASRHELVIYGEYYEKAVSGTVEGMDRPEFARMIGDCTANGVRVILVENMDRLARDLMVSEMLLSECRKRGIVVYCASHGTPLDMATCDAEPQRKFIRQVFGAVAELDKSMLVNKLRSARERVRLQTGKCEGRKPYGTRPGEALVLQLMDTLRDDGSSYDRVTAFLNSSGYHNRQNRPWTRQTLRSVYLNHQKRKDTYSCVEPTSVT